MDDNREPDGLPDKVVLFRPRGTTRPAPVPNLGRALPQVRATGQRFVYDVQRWNVAFAVTFQGKAITRHDSLQAALENARLIAGNFWAMGQPTMVRLINDDRTISPIVSFG